MIEYRKGNILDSDTEAIVNPVNCVGVMGIGLAKQFKERYSSTTLNTDYIDACESGLLLIGKVWPWKNNKPPPQWVICFPTKYNWRMDSQYIYIKEGLYNLSFVLRKYSIKSVSIPKLGCGYGGLSWSYVKSIITDWYEDYQKQFKLVVYE